MEVNQAEVRALLQSLEPVRLRLLTAEVDGSACVRSRPVHPETVTEVAQVVRWTHVVTVAELLDGHVVLDIEFLDPGLPQRVRAVSPGRQAGRGVSV